jgi:hypothetical protein
MILKPQDVLVLLKLVSIYPHEWAYNTLAVDLGMSPSEVHAAVKRSVKAGLANQGEFQIKPNISRLEEFLVLSVDSVVDGNVATSNDGMIRYGMIRLGCATRNLIDWVF